jgi:alpha-1,3-rhamnosyl/mannosyltransferase
MRIALDITPLFQDQPTGVAYYCASVLNALTGFENEHDYVLFGVCPRGLRDKVHAQLDVIAPNAHKKIVFVPQKIQQSLLRILQSLPIALIDRYIGRADIFHQFDSYSFTSKSVVTATIFDISALKFPEMHDKNNLFIQRSRLKLVQKRSHHFFAISKTIKKELMNAWSMPSELISVVYPPINNRQKLVPNCNKFACIKKTPELFSLSKKGDFFVSVATREPRKNIATLIEAHRQLDEQMRKKHPLVIVGARGWGKKLMVNKHDSIWVTGYLCEKCLSYVYAQALALVYISQYEGFGMPIAEAMRKKLPVICSDIPIFKEIAGDVAMFVDAKQPSELTKVMEKSIAMSPSKRRRIIALGLSKVDAFAATISASVMVSAWVRLVQSAHENRDL